MNERSKELLSAYLDGDLNEEEAAELASYWANQPDLLTMGRRYQLIGEVLRSRRLDATATTPCLVARLQHQMEHQISSVEDSDAHSTVTPLPSRLGSNAHSNTRGVLWRRAVKPAAACLFAASIAALAVGAVRIWSIGDTQHQRGLASAAQQAPSPRPGNWQGAEPQVERKLNIYLANHSEVSGGRTAAPRVRWNHHEQPANHVR